MFITGTKTNHTIILNNDHKFGNSNAPGAQHKGNAIIDGKDMFIKADDINPMLGNWEPRYDYEHSSITEAIVSKFIANLDDDFNSVQYEYVSIQHGNMTTTGTISENYVNNPRLIEVGAYALIV